MSKNTTVTAGSLSQRDTLTGMLIIAFMFFMFGFTSWINAILIPYFKISFELSHVQSYLVTFAFYISYLIFSVPASYLLKNVGFKKGMMIGFWVMSTGAFLFVPAAITMTYELFLLGLFSIGAGLALLQTAANPYITILGPKERAAQRFSIMGICNKGAGILAPLLFAAVIFKATDSAMLDNISTMSQAEKDVVFHELIQRVIVPYACVGTFLFLIGLFIRFSPLPEIDTEHESDEVAQANSSKTSITQFPHLILGAFAIFLHVGTQVISIDTVISYAGTMNLNLIEAKVFPSYTLTAQICAYLIGIVFIPKFFSQLTALRVSTILGIILTLLIIYAKGQVSFLGHTNDISLWFVVMLGLANSLVWAGIWPLALDGLGRFTKIGASLMVMGLAGNAILPMVYGYFVDIFNARDAYWVLFPCYMYLVFYAFRGYRLRSWKS
ncbi:glucose/galactose transporter [Daejeonella rubra]|uniref:Glucose/galactose transporter n=1 Tax=Daejeonella rubra TaxID=990371 RepID=A0A1G9SLE7_9SPHI|nr:sugar MFS transporter [Daejeonella rubra]SDM36100.1 glucose/galactose transporter [Daejeonella rubra]